MGALDAALTPTIVVCHPVLVENKKWAALLPLLSTGCDSDQRKEVDSGSSVKPLSAVTEPTLPWFLAQPSSKLPAGTSIGCETTSAVAPLGPGSVMPATIGGLVTSEPDTANTCSTSGAPLVSVAVIVCCLLVAGALT